MIPDELHAIYIFMDANNKLTWTNADEQGLRAIMHAKRYLTNDWEPASLHEVTRPQHHAQAILSVAAEMLRDQKEMWKLLNDPYQL